MGLILHIGPHKTGTTAIQKGLLDNRGRLAELDIRYPEIGFHYYGHHKIAEALTQPRRADEATQYLSAIAQLPGTVVVSSENFSKCSPEAVARIREIIPGDVTVVCYLRSFLEIPYAWWQEQIKHGKTLEFTACLSEMLLRPHQNHLFGISRTLEAWCENFGEENLRLFSYEAARELPDGGTFAHFMKTVLGVTEYTTSPGLQTINRSFDAAGVETMRALNVLGWQGLALLQDSPAAKALRDLLRVRGEKYRRSILVDYGTTTFRMLEKSLLDRWGKAIEASERLGSGGLFPERSKVLSFLDPVAWVAEADLAAALKNVSR